MPDKTKDWKLTAILMRYTTYAVLGALVNGPLLWKELRELSGLSDGTLQRILKDLLKAGLVDKKTGDKPSGFSETRYVLSKFTVKNQIYEKIEELRENMRGIAAKK